MNAHNTKIPVRVAEVKPINDLVTRFTFVRPDGSDLPPFSAGSHTLVEMSDGEITRLNPYSLMSNPADLSHYQIAVRRDDVGRGGSLFMHTQVKTDMKMTISSPVNLFGLDWRAKKHLLIAGGIGITPFIAQTYQLAQINALFELHYSARSPALASFADELTSRFNRQTHLYFDDQNQAINPEELLKNQPLGTHVYICGPKGMIDWLTGTAYALGWPKNMVHFEEFAAPASGTPFSVELIKSNITVEIGEHQSLLEAIEAADVDAPYLCRGGACGQCETNVVSCDGEIEHNDHWLTDEQKTSGKFIMPCVSRFKGDKLVIER